MNVKPLRDRVIIRTVEEKKTTGWGLFEEDGRVKGFFGSIPVKYSVKGQLLSGCNCGW